MTKHIIITTLFFAVLGLGTTQAQNTGKFNFSAGIGLVPTFIADGANVNTPPVSLRMGYQVTPSFGLSTFAGYSSYNSASPYLVNDGQLAQVSNQQYLAGLRGEIRKDFEGKFDIYGGGMLGYNHTTTREFDPITGETILRDQDAPTHFNPNEPKGKLLYSGFIGGTYFLQKHVGLFAEVGYGVSLLNAGVTVRL